MSKVTSKLQVTIPKAIAKRYRIQPGQEVEWLPAGETIRVVPSDRQVQALDIDSKLGLFDTTTKWLRQRAARRRHRLVRNRDWIREDLYDRGFPR